MRLATSGDGAPEVLRLDNAGQVDPNGKRIYLLLWIDSVARHIPVDVFSDTAMNAELAEILRQRISE